MIREKSQKGFTIVELMIALVLTGIIMAAVYGVYTTFYKTSGSQDLLTEAQQNARAGAAIITGDLLNAGLNAGTINVIKKAKSDEIKFIFRDPRPDTQGYTNTRFEMKYKLKTESGIKYLVKKYNVCASGDANCCTYNNSGYGDADEENKIVGYIADTNGLVFTYYDGNGSQISYSDIDTGDSVTEQTNRNTIRLVKVEITTKTSSPLPTSNALSSVKVSTQVYLRNMGVLGGSASVCDDAD
ncbi:MAG: prepilin-type N-terminal cleavage/methylation domain-containing protein [Deltaproteobacteria bacterium]|nr:prepilin-type N-terminal cleavage/methylation domain-containing protein [Deltaproteobacteria bacterium]